MKFITILSPLFIVSSVLSFSFHNNLSKFSKREITSDITPECQNEIDTSKDYLDCYGVKITTTNYKEVCDTIATDRCQKIIKDPFIAIPSCKNDKVFVENLLTPLAIEYNIHQVPLVCSFDSKGNLCPAGEAAINHELINELVVFQTCKSKKCSDSARQYFEFILNNADDLGSGGIIRGLNNMDGSTAAKLVYGTLLKQLNDEKCKARNEENDSSDAEIVKVTYLLSIIITLALISLL